MTERRAASIFSSSTKQRTTVRKSMIELQQLTKRYGDKLAVGSIGATIRSFGPRRVRIPPTALIP
jgi:hypothetical protein